MKMNKWTIGLAAVGVVSLSSVAQAQEDAAGAAAAGGAASSVEINGYVSTSYRMDTQGDTRANTGYANEVGRSRFNLDVIDLQIGKGKSTGDWATGFMVETWIGDQASNLSTDTDGDGSEELAVKQAYIEMNTPIEGLELKLGVFDTIIGYEYHNFNSNALHSRSWGFTIEPTTHTGLLASYAVSESLSVNLGIANTVDARINQGDDDAKTILASASYKLPEGWWPWATADNPAGINLGLITGKEGDQTDSHSFYASADLPLPAGFGLGLVVDLQKNNGTDGSNGTGAFNQNGSDNVVVGAYLTKEISDKLDAVIRYEFADVPEYAADGNFLGGAARTSSQDDYTSSNEKGDKIHSITVGLSYDLWEDVITRIEYRVDNGVGLINHDTNTASHVIASVIYEF